MTDDYRIQTPPTGGAMSVDTVGRLRGLIVLGRERQYLLRSEIRQSLTQLSDEQLADVAQTLDDMGIPVFTATPSFDQLQAALQRPKDKANGQDDDPWSAGAASDTGKPVAEPIVVLHLGAEGGDLRLLAQQTDSGWRFRATPVDQSLSWIDETDQEIQGYSRWVASWEAALRVLDRYPWSLLRPLEVHPEYRDRILTAVMQRLDAQTDSPTASVRRTEWTGICRVPR